MHITNATGFWVNITIGGTPGIGNIPGLERWLGIKVFRPRSSSIICAVNENQPKSMYRTIEFGQRLPGDFVLRAQKEHVAVSENTQLPRYLIEFNDEGLILTSVLIKLNVSEINIPTVSRDSVNESMFAYFLFVFFCFHFADNPSDNFQ